MPRGGQRGTDVAVEFHGDRLGDVVELMAHEPGISIANIDATPTKVKATLKIAPDCPLGEHALRLRTTTGLSGLRTFWVGALSVVDEKEPNNDISRSQKIPLNCTVHGTIGNEDVDHFAVQVKKGERLTVEVEAMRLGGIFFDAQVTILNARGKELLHADDTPLTGQDPCCSMIVPEDGTYIIRIREASLGAGDWYRMHVGTMPRPMAIYPPGGKPGDEVEVTFLGDARGPVKKKVALPAEQTERFRLWLDDADGASPSPIPFRLVDLPNILESEPNDSPIGASLGVVPCAFNGIIEKPRDRDHFKFWVKKGQVYDLRCFARKLGSPLDPVLWIAGLDGKVIASNDDNEGQPDSYLRFTAPDDQQYIVGIRDHLDRGGPCFVYRIEVTPVQPRIELSLQRVGEPPSQERLTVVVPKGNRMAALVNVRRVDAGGPLNLEFDGLPEKVAVQTELVPAGQSLVPVLLEAEADATTSGTMTSLTAKGPNTDAPSRYEQSIIMIAQANQSYYHTYRSEKLPVVVTEPAPFRIELVEPRAPLVRGGTMQLKVVAERLGDFKGTIRVQSLYNPPGVSAPGEVLIPEGKQEAMIPLTANANAGIGAWKYAVIGTGDAGGLMRVSSQLAKLNVAAPFVQITLERANVEQGGQGMIRGKVTVVTPFNGSAKIQLVGLPPKLKAPDIEITSATKDVSFGVTADPTCPPGPVRNLFCQVSLIHDGEAVTHSTGTTDLRVDVPLKKKVAAKAASKP